MLFALQLLLSLAAAYFLSNALLCDGPESPTYDSGCNPLQTRALYVRICRRCPFVPHSVSPRATSACISLSLLLALFVGIAHTHEPTARSEKARAFASATSFIALAYIEVHRERGEPAQSRASFRAFLCAFLASVGRAAALSVCVIAPVAAVGIAVCFLVLGSMFNAIGMSTRVLDTPIYVCVLYGPYASIYFAIKREWRREQSWQPLLPTTSQRAAARRTDIGAHM